MIQVVALLEGKLHRYELTLAQREDLLRVCETYEKERRASCARTGRTLEAAGLVRRDDRFRLAHWAPTDQGFVVRKELRDRETRAAQEALPFVAQTRSAAR